MKILHILGDAELGGGPRAVELLAAGLRGMGHEIAVAMPKGPATAIIEATGVQVSTSGRISNLVQEADVVHTHGKLAGLLGRISAHRMGKQVVHTHHGLHFRGLSGHVWLGIERWLARKFTAATIHVAHHQAARGKAIGLSGITIPLGLDENRIERLALSKKEARFMLGLSSKEQIVGAVGRLDRVKRWDLALYGMPTSARIVFMGNGAEYERLFRRARRIGIDASFIPARRDGWAYLRAFDVLVLPSREEGCPLIVLEAAALGVPILCSDIPAHREILGADSPYLVKTDWDWNAKLTYLLGTERLGLLRPRPIQVDKIRREHEHQHMVTSHDALYRRLVV